MDMKLYSEKTAKHISNLLAKTGYAGMRNHMLAAGIEYLWY